MSKEEAKPAEGGTSNGNHRQANGWFRPGNPGRPKGYPNGQNLVKRAIEAAEKKRASLKEPCACVTAFIKLTVASQDDLWERSCKTLDEHFARRAFLDDDVLVALERKRIPDVKADDDGGGRPLVVQVISYGSQPAQVSVG
mgnify:CR=1 FL=1